MDFDRNRARSRGVDCSGSAAGVLFQDPGGRRQVGLIERTHTETHGPTLPPPGIVASRLPGRYQAVASAVQVGPFTVLGRGLAPWWVSSRHVTRGLLGGQLTQSDRGVFTFHRQSSCSVPSIVRTGNLANSIRFSWHSDRVVGKPAAPEPKRPTENPIPLAASHV
jgi:hypothetical protein